MNSNLTQINNSQINTIDLENPHSTFWQQSGIDIFDSEAISKITDIDAQILFQTEEEDRLSQELSWIRYQKGAKVTELMEEMPKKFWKGWLIWRLFSKICPESELDIEERKCLRSHMTKLNNYKCMFFAVNSILILKNNKRGANVSPQEFFKEYQHISDNIWYVLGRETLKENGDLYNYIFEHIEIGEKMTPKSLAQAKEINALDISFDKKQALFDATFKGSQLDIGSIDNTYDNRKSKFSTNTTIDISVNESIELKGSNLENADEVENYLVENNENSNVTPLANSISANQVFPLNSSNPQSLVTIAKENNQQTKILDQISDQEIQIGILKEVVNNFSAIETENNQKDLNSLKSEVAKFASQISQLVNKNKNLKSILDETRLKLEIAEKDLVDKNEDFSELQAKYIKLEIQINRIKSGGGGSTELEKTSDHLNTELKNEESIEVENNLHLDDSNDDVYNEIMNLDDDEEKIRQIIKQIKSSLTPIARLKQFCLGYNLSSLKSLKPAALRKKMEDYFQNLLEAKESGDFE